MDLEAGTFKWYAVSTYPNQEKKAFRFLQRREVTTFLPTCSRVHKWRNGAWAKLEVPLFPGYLFVQISLRDRIKVLQVPGIAHIISFSGVPAEIPEIDIERLRSGIAGLRPEPHPYIKVGHVVSVRSGPLAGMQGIVIRLKSETRIVITMDLLMRAISVEVDPANLEHVVRPSEASAFAGEHGQRVSYYESASRIEALSL